MSYEAKTDIYEGPLPLLVELAKLNLIDVFIIKLVDLTGQYLAQLKTSGQDLNRLAEPLPLLGQLVAIKARGLLPDPNKPVEDEEVPISLEELERRLKEYEQFKTVAQLLSELHALQHKHFTRAPGELPESAEVPAEERPFEVGITDLMSAFAKVLSKATAPVYEVKVEPWTVELKVKELRTLLHIKREVRFLDLFTPDKSKLELVVTFLAILELMRQRAVHAVQHDHFGDIFIEAREHILAEQQAPPAQAAVKTEEQAHG